MTVTKNFVVHGKVQGIMFRQTLIRGAHKRGLKAAATNNPNDTNEVSFVLEGKEEIINQLTDRLQNGEPINSWGAHVTELIEIDEDNGIPFDLHQVSTDNVDEFNWSPNVDFFL